MLDRTKLAVDDLPLDSLSRDSVGLDGEDFANRAGPTGEYGRCQGFTRLEKLACVGVMNIDVL